MRKGVDVTVRKTIELLSILLSGEIANREYSIMELMELMRTDFRTLQRYLKALESVGWVEVVPTERKNIVRLTDRGRCIARCLVG